MKTTRHTFLLTLAIAVLALPAMAAPKKKVLNLFCWSEYVPDSVIKGFTKETGIKVNVENYASNEEMLSKLLVAGSKYDLIQPSEYTIEALAKANKLETLDLSRIPNFKNIGAPFKSLPHDPDNKFSVPWMTGSVGIVINTRKVKDEIKGYADVFSGKYKNRIVVLDDNREMVSWALATLGLGVNDITSENLAKVKPILQGWIPQIKVYNSDSPKTPLANGDVDLGIVWSGEAAILIKEHGEKFKYVLPENAHMFIDSLAIPKGAPNADAAHQFIDYILRPEVSKIISENFPYTNPNMEARKLLPEAQLKNTASYPAGDPKLDTFKDIGKVTKEIDKLVTDLKNK
ncbi:MAG: potD [Chthoniobacteraceae bacterium]|nr:potD [Chthoniobacteraceae bacterium]